MKTTYQVKRMLYRGPWVVEVPGSKSISNRALMLAAMARGECELHGVLFSDDSRAFLDCLDKLGFDMEIDEARAYVKIKGCGGDIPNRSASVNVRSAGTAARFLTVMLALAGGDYEMNSSEQMMKRPMEPLLSILAEAGVEFEFKGENGHFPFVMHSHSLNLREVEVDTTVSSQFTSALLMSGVLMPDGLDIDVTGSRTEGSYIKMTLSMMRQFGIDVTGGNNHYHVPGRADYGISRYDVEPDVSGAAYFYSLAPMLGADVMVKRVHRLSLQGDMRYIELLERLGCALEDSAEGLWVRGEGVSHYPGITVDMKDFSDQTMTMAAVAVYADSPTEIHNVGHIRYQESDRLHAILTELKKMGIECEELSGGEGVRIIPGKPVPSLVDTYEDHRMAMSFTLIGMRTDGIVIDNPQCCRKTFENYYIKIDELYKKPRISALLIDLDNTIMDFDACSRLAVRASLQSAGITADEKLIDRYIAHNDRMWKRLERREITRDELQRIRWQLFFDEEHIEYDGPEFESIYRKNLMEQHVMIPGAQELLEYLSGKYELYMATNGIYDTQRRRIEKAGIGRYFKEMFVSEKVGADKPSQQYFEYCIQHMNGVSAQEIAVIGDSLTADMKGGAQAGLVTCWYNPKGIINDSTIHCDYVVENFEQIAQIL